MKRVIPAICLLLLIAAASLGALWEQRRATTVLLELCDSMQMLYDSGDLEACAREAEALTARLETETRWFPFFLRHDHMESLFQNAAALPSLVADEDRADFCTSLSAIRMQLNILLDNEQPYPRNIL